MAKKILVVEDNKDIADLVKLHLRNQSYACDCVADGDEGLKKALSGKYDLVILDVVLPGTDGMEICKRMREEKIESAILMLTSKSEELDKVLGLELGADDYLTKPFSVREFVARVKAIVRRVDKAAKSSSDSGVKKPMKFGDIVIDMEKYKVLKRGKPVELTAKEFDMLYLLARHPKQVFTREQLLERVWGGAQYIDPSTVTVHVRRLREKIEADPSQPKHLLTIWGVGYKFEP